MDTLRFLYASNMDRGHDVDMFLKLLRNERISFVCIGGGAKRIEDVKVEGLEESFLFLPDQDKRYVPYLTMACDVSLVRCE